MTIPVVKWKPKWWGDNPRLSWTFAKILKPFSGTSIPLKNCMLFVF